ncbi:actin-rearrangement-inducing factor 1 [Choristoneura rosaceana nucleopolyhedrovirus]|uniref:Actin-rearrangement-inducing factor 1 n=1 Tax=Choristoneura rosaceana nucleopolyhedrovirus TaxID=58094 RepID=S5N457_9ABAC|nr:actin-rearrangement-inducing factor 1 [Choristoneura rosaceana nucleopolyhedrovirus]AGR57170.1 actin-rearrangement-inducing factor 1 [Choristoneura rosaceana nucleopolyhedrovirus]
MLVQINYFLQLVLDATLYAVCSGAFVFSFMGTIKDQYAILLELEDSYHSVINLSFLSTFLLGPYVFTIIWAMFTMALCYKRHSNFYMKTTIALAHLLALSCWIIFVLFQPQLYKNGHLPVLDALERDYDRQSLCWSNIVFISYEVHDASAINYDRNCVYQDDFLKKCVGCRLEVKHDEPTFFNQNQGALIVSVLFAIVMHCWNMYVQIKKMRFKPDVKQNRKSASLDEAESAYDSAEENEHQDNIRMLQIVSEDREINFDGPPTSSFIRADMVDTICPLINSFTQQNTRILSPPSSSNSGHGAIHYDTPKAIYKVPRKIAVPVAPPKPVAPIAAQTRPVPIPPPKPVTRVAVQTRPGRIPSPKSVTRFAAQTRPVPIPLPKPVIRFAAHSRPVL